MSVKQIMRVVAARGDFWEDVATLCALTVYKRQRRLKGTGRKVKPVEEKEAEH